MNSKSFEIKREPIEVLNGEVQNGEVPNRRNMSMSSEDRDHSSSGYESG